jgi:hypothetical protein
MGTKVELIKDVQTEEAPYSKTSAEGIGWGLRLASFTTFLAFIALVTAAAIASLGLAVYGAHRMGVMLAARTQLSVTHATFAVLFTGFGAALLLLLYAFLKKIDKLRLQALDSDFIDFLKLSHDDDDDEDD